MALSAGNLGNLCRVCTGEFANMINLFSVRRKGLLLAEMLSVCVQNAIDQSDTMPQKICSTCLEQLCAAYVFCRLAQKSDAVFKELIDSPTKSEVMSEDGHFESADTLVDLDESSSDETSAAITVSTPETAANTRKARNINVSTPITRSAKRDIPAKVRTPLKSVAITKPSKIKPPPSKNTAVKVKSTRKTPSKEFECYLCKAKPGSLREAKRHLRSHDKATPHQCQICSMRYSSRGLAEHSCDGQSIECAYCPAVFRVTTDLLQHLDEHKQHQKLYKCTECAKMFAMPYLLELHKRQHNGVEKKFACDDCGRRFEANHALLRHRRTHSKFRPHLCATCGMGFKTMSTLSKHAVRHSSVRPIACPKCPSRFYEKNDLRKHMDVHSDIKYVCSICGNSLNSKRSLDEHTRLRHGKRKNHACEFCELKFFTVDNLKRHLLTHTGEKPHKCEHCDRAFAQKGDLNKHLRSHLGENLYHCTVCDKRFRLQIDLRKHSYEHFQSGSEAVAVGEAPAV